MSGRRLNAPDCKARCLALLDEVRASGESITILDTHVLLWWGSGRRAVPAWDRHHCRRHSRCAIAPGEHHAMGGRNTCVAWTARADAPGTRVAGSGHGVAIHPGTRHLVSDRRGRRKPSANISPGSGRSPDRRNRAAPRRHGPHSGSADYPIGIGAHDQLSRVSGRIGGRFAARYERNGPRDRRAVPTASAKAKPR